MADIQSRPYLPDAEMCCEACVFLHGLHAPWCDKNLQPNPEEPATAESSTMSVRGPLVSPAEPASVFEEHAAVDPHALDRLADDGGPHHDAEGH